MPLLTDFEQIARDKLIGFTRGQWLVDKVNAYLRNPSASPFLLITGGPGMGKSAFAAHLWLVEKIPQAVHFCVGGRGGTLNALTFVESVSQQLAVNTPRFGEALGEVQTSLPGRTTNVVNQYFQGPVTNSTVVGFALRGDGSPARAFDLLVRRPLQMLADRKELNQTVVLVDGLDESLTSLSARRDEEFVKVLSQAGDVPKRVRFVFTSKPDSSVSDYLQGAERIAIEAQDPAQQEDVRAFLRQQFQSHPGLRSAAQNAGWSEQTFAQNLAEATEFNFFYLTLVLPEIARSANVAQVGELPPTLDEYYRRLLQTRIGSGDWKKWGNRLAEVLLAIQEPASLSQIANWLKWSTSVTAQRLGQFGQLLDPHLGGQRLYWRHHFSLVNFLLDEKRAGSFLCDGRRGHKRVANYYLSDWGGLKNGFPELPVPDVSTAYDEYPYRHLSKHLYFANGKMHEALFALADHRQWYDAQKAFDPSGATYLLDLSQAWLAAEEYDSRIIARRSQAPLMGREVRCALGIASLRAGIPAALLRALVQSGKRSLWSLEDALNAARNNPDSYAKAKALLALATLGHTPNPGVLAEALTAADEIYQPWARAAVRAEVAAQLSPQEQRIVLAETLRWALKLDSEWQLSETLASLAPHLPEDLAVQAVDACSKMQDASDRLHVLLAVAPRLPENRLCAALDDQRFRSGEYEAADATIRLLYLPHTHHEDLSSWEAALSQAGSSGNQVWRGKLLAAMAPTLPGSLLRAAKTIADTLSPHRRDEVLVALAARLAGEGDYDGAMALARAIWIPWRLAQALQAIVPRLPSSRFPEALEVAQSIADDASRAEALALVVDFLPETEREAVLQAALSSLKHTDGDHQTLAIAAFAPFLSKTDLPDVLAAVEKMNDESLMTSAFVTLAPHLPEDLMERALDLASGLVQARYEARALQALMPHLPIPLMSKALDATGAIGDKGHSAKVLAVLAPRLPDSLLARALELAKWAEGIDERVEVIAALSPSLPGSLLRETVAAVQASGDGNSRARGLAALIPHLPKRERRPLLHEAFKAIKSEWYVTDLVHAALAQCLTVVGRYRQAIKHADCISSSGAVFRVETVAVLARHVPDELLNEAYRVASATTGWKEYVRALMSLAGRLGERPLREILDKLPNLNGAADRVSLLALVMPYVPEDSRRSLLKQALHEALKILDPTEKERALARLAPSVTRPSMDNSVAKSLYGLWREVLHSVTQHPGRRRQELLGDVGAFAPILAALGGSEAVAEAVQAIQVVGKWWG